MGHSVMRAGLPLIGLACVLLLVLASCFHERDGQQVLFDNPALLTRLLPGTTRAADAEALLGPPGGKIDGILVQGSRFYQLSEEVKEPGAPAVQWSWWASRSEGIGPWPIGMERKESKSLTLIFDAAGVLRDVRRFEHHGAWEKNRIINKLF